MTLEELDLINPWDYLGRNGEDKLSGFRGKIVYVAIHMSGCIFLTIQPPVNKDHSLPECRSFSLERIKVSGSRLKNTPDSWHKCSEYLGRKAKDRITGFVGITYHLAFSYSGWAQVSLLSEVSKSEKMETTAEELIDTQRIEFLDKPKEAIRLDNTVEHKPAPGRLPTKASHHY